MSRSRLANFGYAAPEVLAGSGIFGNAILPVWLWLDPALLDRAETVEEALTGLMHVDRNSTQQALDLRGPAPQDILITA